MGNISNEVKIAIKNALLHFQNSDDDFNPQSFLDILCAECRSMGIKFNECDWFGAWSGRFDSAIKKELQNSPIKTHDDFIDKIAQICNHKHSFGGESKEVRKVLQKALALLKARGIVDIGENLPLNAIDSKLSALIESGESSESNLQHFGDFATNFKTQKISNFFANIGAQHIKIDKNQRILLCKFSEQAFIKKLDLNAHNRLLHSFCAILLNNLSAENVIGIYKNAVAIFTKSTIDAIKREIERILEANTFMLHNKPLRLKIDFEVVKFGELK